MVCCDHEVDVCWRKRALDAEAKVAYLEPKLDEVCRLHARAEARVREVEAQRDRWQAAHAELVLTTRGEIDRLEAALAVAHEGIDEFAADCEAKDTRIRRLEVELRRAKKTLESIATDTVAKYGDADGFVAWARACARFAASQIARTLLTPTPAAAGAVDRCGDKQGSFVCTREAGHGGEHFEGFVGRRASWSPTPTTPAPDEKERSIDECPDCGGWLGPIGSDGVSDGAIHTCTDCEVEWAADVYDGRVEWRAVTPAPEQAPCKACRSSAGHHRISCPERDSQRLVVPVREVRRG